MKKKQFVFGSLLVLLLTSTTVFSQVDFNTKDKVFNGKNLKNWRVLPDQPNIWWTVNEGVLLAKSDIDQTGSTLWTKKTYEDFAVRLEFKMGDGTVDSGVFLRGENPESPQIQIGISGSLKVDMTGSPYVPKQGYPKKAEIENILQSKAWNTMTIIAEKNNYKVWLNNQMVLNYTLENASLEGPVGLQLHPGRTMEIEFREIFIKKL
jgi:hypothetical protein